MLTKLDNKIKHETSKGILLDLHLKLSKIGLTVMSIEVKRVEAKCKGKICLNCKKSHQTVVNLVCVIQIYL